MKNFFVDLEKKELTVNKTTVSLHSAEGYEAVKKVWEYVNWANKYSYNFTWLGRPIIQLPDDMIRIQEIIFRVKPTVIIETGIAHGGSLVYYASLLKMIGEGRVIGIDIDIRQQNRLAIEKHPMFPMITLIEESSTSNAVIELVKKQITKDDVVLVILDSCHSKEHVLNELRLYSKFITLDSYILVADGIMEEVVGAPRTEPDWSWNNPQEAVREFLLENKEFLIEKWEPIFTESNLCSVPTYYQNGFLRKVL